MTHLRDTLIAHFRSTVRYTFQRYSDCECQKDTGYTSQRYSDCACQKCTVSLHISEVLWLHVSEWHSQVHISEVLIRTAVRLHSSEVLWLHVSEVHSQPTHLRDTLTARVRTPICLRISEVLWLQMSGGHRQATHLRDTLTTRIRRTHSGIHLRIHVSDLFLFF